MSFLVGLGVGVLVVLLGTAAMVGIAALLLRALENDDRLNR